MAAMSCLCLEALQGLTLPRHGLIALIYQSSVHHSFLGRYLGSSVMIMFTLLLLLHLELLISLGTLPIVHARFEGRARGNFLAVVSSNVTTPIHDVGL